MLRRGARVLAQWVLAASLGACAVGPNFERPNAGTGTYIESPLPTATTPAPGEAGGEIQTMRVGNDLAQDWWTLFHSEALNRLVEEGLRDSPNLAAASAALRQARETLAADKGNLQLPGVNAQALAERERLSGAEFGAPKLSSTFSLYNAQVNVSYTFDLFGSVRRQIEAAQAQVDYQAEQLRGAQLALTANIVTAVIREAQLRDQIRAWREVEKLQRSGLEIVEARFELGAVTRNDVLSQRTALAQTLASISPLERQRVQTRHQMAAYVGKAPSELDMTPFELARLALPVNLPVSLPSELVRQRPDILASEAMLHVASAQVGVATANLYPQITLGADYGAFSLTPQTLFKPESVLWGLNLNVAQPIFHGGALQAQRRAAIAAFDQAAALYRQTVVTAFANVADALQALEIDARTLAAQSDAYAQAHAAADLADDQFRNGALSYLSLLNAQQQFAQSAVALEQARADRFADTAALFQALGGGWWNQAGPEAEAKPLARTE